MSEFDFQDPNGPKSPAIPQFYVEPMKMEFKSKEAGRPIFEDREYVRIIIPGDRRTQVVEMVNDEHKARWPKHYEAFKAGLEAPSEGTPLKDWPPISRSQVEELAYHHVRTLEQLAGVDDLKLQNLGMGMHHLRAQARLSLEMAAKGTAPLSKLIAENERLNAEVVRLTRELTESNTELRILKDRKEPTHAGA